MPWGVLLMELLFLQVEDVNINDICAHTEFADQCPPAGDTAAESEAQDAWDAAVEKGQQKEDGLRTSWVRCRSVRACNHARTLRETPCLLHSSRHVCVCFAAVLT